MYLRVPVYYRVQIGISNFTPRCADLARFIIPESFTESRAASSKLSTGKILSPAEPIITFASSTFVPYLEITDQ